MKRKYANARRAYQSWHDVTEVLKKLWNERGLFLLLAFTISIASVLTIGLLRGLQVAQIGQAFLAVGVAILPLGLLGSILFRLMIAAHRMLEIGARVKNLSIIDHLANVDVICADKKGLFTENRLTVVAMDVANQEVNLTEQYYPDENVNLPDNGVLEISPTQALLLVGGALCGNAELIREDDGAIHAIGDLTDGALVITAARAGFWKKELDRAFPRIREIPFDFKRKRMTTVHQLSDFAPNALLGVPIDGMSHVVFTKGAVEKLLHLSTYLWVDGQAEKVNTDWKRRIRAAESKSIRQGKRVLAVAFRTFSSLPTTKNFERGLTFIGLFGMVDPPRQSIREAVDTCQEMGIRPIVITDDRPSTAKKAFQDLGLSERVLTGSDLKQLSEKKYLSTIEDVQVFARISGEQRLQLVQALQTQKHVVAATSDEGDARILKGADISVGLGLMDAQTGYAHLTLLDNHFATLVAALQEANFAKQGLILIKRMALVGWITRMLLITLAIWFGWSIKSLVLPILCINLLFDGGLGLLWGLRR